MSSHRTLRHAVVAAIVIGAFLCQGTWALAETTGNIAGVIRDASGAPIAGVQVQAVAPSETRTATTDAGGHFIILSLSPDTYTLSLSKPGFENVSFPGVTVFADQTQQVAYTLRKVLRTIAHVTSQAAASLVKPGVGGDLYSVNAAQASASAALGGGGNLNNAYSAMASVPGIQTSQGGIGWDYNAAYVRGQNSYYTGYEYDGIPVNRSFDNYNASTESALGLQELQVYTGGGPSSVASAGTAGFINQVIKTGTFPGFGTANLGIGTPQFYHQAQVEIGGSTPDRTFSWYIGLLGYNQAYRTLDNSDGAGYMTPNGPFAGPTLGTNIGYGFNSNQVLAVCYTCVVGTGQGVKATCPLLSAGADKFTFPAQGCWQYYSGLDGSPLNVSDRENVINLHMGIPKRNGLRDDVQLMWSGSALANYNSLSPTELGPGSNEFSYESFGTQYRAPTCGPETIGPGLTVNGCNGTNGQIAAYLQPEQLYWERFQGLGPGPYTCPAVPFACGPTYTAYGDNVVYNVPFGSPIARNATSVKAPSVYYAPDTPAHPYLGAIPLTDNSANVNRNDTGITKLQYTYALSQSAYLRAYAYTFYSDWLQSEPIYGGAFTSLGVPSPLSPEYDLFTHTAGGALEFQDQLNDQNLLSLGGNYTTATTERFNNYTAYEGCRSTCSGGSPIGYMAKTGNGYTCYDPTSGAPQPCVNATSGYCTVTATACAATTPTWISSAQAGPTSFAKAGSPAAKAGATWDSLWQGNATGPLNNVSPRFTNAALQDQFRPSDRFLINASIRYDNFTYDLPNTTNAATAFYGNQIANYTCVIPSTNTVLLVPLPPGGVPPAPAQYVNGDCDKAVALLHASGPKTGWVHPNGTTQDGVAAPNWTATSPNSYALDYWEPRFSATYTANPDTVIRASAGRFTQPPISASVQYLGASGDLRSVWGTSMALGFYSPFHPIPGISSGQYDLSLEQHLHGTDMSFKLTPFFTWVQGWQQQSFIGAGFVTQVPVGVNRDEGVEFQFNKGDFSRNGLSGLLAFTYTSSKVQFQNYPVGSGFVSNGTTVLNQAIQQYNLLTKAGGGSPCYQAATAVACSTPNGKIAKGFDTILNPYYGQPSQGLINPNGWYNPYSTQVAPNLYGFLNSYIAPYTSALVLNWRQNKLAITPSINFQSGTFYGSPVDVNGVDPRTCQVNSAASGITKLSPKTPPLQCNYLYALGASVSTFGYLYIPNPQTGTFAFDNIEQPDSVVGNLQLTYDVSPRIRLTVLGTNLFHACFGGTPEPWTAAYPPSNVFCAYTPAGGVLNSTLYPANFYNGTGINDLKANGVRSAYTQSYTPANNNTLGAIGGGPPPINVYFNAQLRI